MSGKDGVAKVGQHFLEITAVYNTEKLALKKIIGLK